MYPEVHLVARASFLAVQSGAVNWTAGYTPGTTTITLAGVSGLSVGKLIYLDQNDETADGFPATGDTVFASDGAFSYQGGGYVQAPEQGSAVHLCCHWDIRQRRDHAPWDCWADLEKRGQVRPRSSDWCTAGASIYQRRD